MAETIFWFTRFVSHEAHCLTAMHTCSYKGCNRTTTQPADDGWRHLSVSGWGLAVKDGLYCPIHADALEGLQEHGAKESDPRP